MNLRDLDYGFDREHIIENTKKSPVWLHFGAGNIFRAFPCALAQRLLEAGDIDYGIIAAEGFDGEVIKRIYKPYDNLSLMVTFNSDGTMTKNPIGSVTESLYVPAMLDRLREIFCQRTLSFVTFTITEKGYAIRNTRGEILPAVKADAELPPDEAETFMGSLTACLWTRYLHCGAPIALLSLDNCSGNGDKLREAVLYYAREWQKRRCVSSGFIEYLDDESRVSFPVSMFDKISPRPDERVAESLRSEGFTDTEIIVTEKHTYIAPFVNTEAPQYLVVEDKFPAGHPPLEKVGVIFTDRETVEAVERMKVSTCLNPLHTFLAVFGCLLGFNKICDEMKDETLSSLVRRLGYVEGLPVVTDPGIISPKAFIDEVINERLPNPFMPDTPQRIATDTSQKLSVRFGQTIKAYAERGLDMSGLKCVPLLAAGWCRYLMAMDDEGNTFAPSSDPLYEECHAHVADIALGGEYSAEAIHEHLSPILSNETIFGVDLYSTPIGNAAEGYFARMISGVGAVRRTLQEENI